MPPTELLYHHDSLMLAFRGTVVAHGRYAGAPSVILDRTAFYPEAGGQMADRGQLGGVAIADVQIDDAGIVHHLVAGALPEIGATVEGTIDRERRRAHMALHTGQHMLSRGLLDEAGGETVSSRLGESSCTIDIDVPTVDERALARAEDLVNSVIDDDVVVRAYFPTADELPTLPLRRPPKVEDHIRVVAIGDFDVSPCGGTHTSRSAQVGLVKITNVERYKGKIRVTFVSGRRARAELGAHSDALRGLGRELTCGPGDVPTALAKLRRELQDAREALGQARVRLLQRTADELLATGHARVTAILPDVDAEGLRILAKRITAVPGRAVVLAAVGADAIHVLAARAPGADLDCGAIIKQLAAAHGGRGGGSPDRAEGKLPLSALPELDLGR